MVNGFPFKIVRIFERTNLVKLNGLNSLIHNNLR